MKTFCIIPARGGSKRIPRKNIRDFCGRPIIAWAIGAARDSQLFDQVIVSTDDEEVARVAREWGAQTPFVRPTELSDDTVATRPVVNHAIRSVAGDEDDFLVCCLYATAPFVEPADLVRGRQCLVESGCEFAMAITAFAFPVQRAIRLTRDGRLAMIQPEYRHCRSQDLEPAYHDAGQFYWGKASAFLANRAIVSDASVPVLIPRHRALDIDTPEDWIQAELMFRILHNEGGCK